MSRTKRPTRSTRFQVESLEGRQVLSTILPRLATAAEVEMLTSPLPNASYAGGSATIVSPVVPIVRADGHTTGATIWGRESNGNLAVNDPLAIAIKASKTINYHFTTPSAYTEGASYRAVLKGTNGVLVSSTSGFTNGREGGITLVAPTQVGQYTLTVQLTAMQRFKEDSVPPSEVRTHKVFALLNTPLTKATVASPPYTSSFVANEAAVIRAVNWAAGATNAEGVVSQLNRKIYSNPLGWQYSNHNPYADGDSYLTGKSTYGNCYNFADVLSYASALHGVNVQMTHYSGVGLIAASHPPLSGRDPANRVPNAFNIATRSADAWMNGDHHMVTFNGKYYDPTFGFTGKFDPNAVGNPDKNWGENLLCHFDESTAYQGSTYAIKDGRMVGYVWWNKTQNRWNYYM